MNLEAGQPVVQTTTPKELVREPLVLNNRSLGWITDQVAGIVEGDMPKWWNIAFGVSFVLMLMSFGYIGYLVTTCLLYTSPSPRDKRQSRMPSSA